MNFSNTLKSHLLSLIDEMASHPQDFTKNPKTDFSRTKKWSFKKTILFMLSMEGNSLKNELLKFFDFNSNLPSASSFIQRRAQILPSTFETLFKSFTSFDKRFQATYGYQLIAVDGSAVAIPRNAADKATLRKVGKDNEYNFPTQDVLNRLSSRSIGILRTDKLNDIRIQTTKNGIHKLTHYTGGA